MIVGSTDLSSFMKTFEDIIPILRSKARGTSFRDGFAMLNALKIKRLLARQHNSKLRILDCDTNDSLLHCIAYGYNNYSRVSGDEHNTNDQFEFKANPFAAYIKKAAECVGIVLNDDVFSNVQSTSELQAISIDVNLLNRHGKTELVRQETIDDVGYNAKSGNTSEPSRLVGGANLLKVKIKYNVHDEQAIISNVLLLLIYLDTETVNLTTT